MAQAPPYGIFRGEARGPNAKQAAFHASRAPFKLFLGGVGSGKSHAGARELLYSALANPPGLTYLIGAPSHNILQMATFESVLQLCNDWSRYNGKKIDIKRRYSPQNRSITLIGGTLLKFVCLRDPEQFAGPSLAGFWVDEACLLDNQMGGWNMLLERLRDTRAHRMFGFATSTPRGNVGLVSHWQERLAVKDPDYYMVTSSTYDNQSNLTEGYIARQMAGKTDRQVRQQINAEILSSEGAIFKEFSNTDSIAHGWNWRRELPKSEIYVAIDWGPTMPHLLWIAHNPDTGVDTVFGEICEENILHTELLERMLTHQQRMWNLRRSDIAKVYCDYNPQAAVRQARSFFGTRAGRDMIPISAKRVKDNHQRNEGIDVVSWRLRDYHGKRRLFFAPEMERTKSQRRILQCMRLYSWQTRRSQGEAWQDEMRPIKGVYDHGADALRYYCYRYRWDRVRASGERPD